MSQNAISLRQSVPFSELELHRAIAWDFDETLVGSKRSTVLHDFIIHHPEIDHHIVTFRSHGEVEKIPDDLAEYFFAPSISSFRSITGIPDSLWEANSTASMRRWIDVEYRSAPMSDVEIEYRHWKAKICVELGITVLIDDATASVSLGCDHYGIRLIHPLDLIA